MATQSTSALAPLSISGAVRLAGASRAPLPVLDFDAGNLSKWNIFLHALLGRHGLLHHVDGSVAAAPNDPVWVQDDCTILSAMYGSISSDTLDIILTTGMTARALWVATEDLFCDNKESHSIVLLQEFHGLQQGDLSITAYCKEQKRLANTLRDAGSAVDDRLLILNILRDLNPWLS
ncbi:uncharacterized protein LOC133930317 [Phragmites australis]|uniref:uncharacterized protein LOC133930317 n=1 Tax=Phragmites australis TaxID=29695 RepID=UPI002D783956|nr:uncharacterized protein LOC133930317 [Phragmites australis]